MFGSSLIPRIPLSKLDLIDQSPSPLKRKAKIFTRKLPQDFFSSKPQSNTERSLANPDRNHIQTHSYSRKMPVSDRLSETREARKSVRGINQGNSMDLFMGIISSTREIRKSIRKHSLQLRKETRVDNVENFVELPPLLLRKGVTAAF